MKTSVPAPLGETAARAARRAGNYYCASQSSPEIMAAAALIGTKRAANETRDREGWR